MNYTQLILGILQIVETVLPLLGGNAQSQNAVQQIIAKLQEWLPLLEGEIVALYTPIKNIIAVLKGSDAATQADKDALHALDAQSDGLFEAAAAKVDPDLPGNS